MAKEGTPSLPVDELAVGNALPGAQPGSSGAGGLSSKRGRERASSLSRIAMVWVATCCLVAQAEQSVSLAWDPSPDTNVIGYAVYYGTVSGTYGSRLDIGPNMTATVP